MRSPEDYGILHTCARTIGLMWGVRRGMLIGVVALAASMNLLGPASAWIRKEIFDAATPLLAAGDDVGWRTVAGSVAGWVALMVLVWAFANALQAAYEAVRSVYAYGIANRAVGLVARRAATLDLVHFEDSRFYDLMDRARIDAAWRPMNVVSVGGSVIGHLVTLVAMAGLLALLHPLAVVFLVVVSLPRAIAALRYADTSFGMLANRAPDRRRASYFAELLTTRPPAAEVRTLGLAPCLVRRYDEATGLLERESAGIELRRSRADIAFQTLSAVGIGAVWVYAVVAVVRGGGTLGDLSLYLEASLAVASAIRGLFFNAGVLFENGLFLRSLFAFLDTADAAPVAHSIPARSVAPDLLATAPYCVPAIDLCDLAFTYPAASAPSIDGVSFSLRGHGLVAVVGHNGAGKTTLVKLLLRLLAPDRGTILVNGIDAREMGVARYRSLFAVAFQESPRYALPLRDYLALGCPDRARDDDRLRAALIEADATAILERLPRGLDTPLGPLFDGGVDLSGGEWQKITLARLLLRDAPILVMDEPTASLDVFAEERLYARLAALRTTKRIVVVSHRFSTVTMADRIVVMDRGRIIEEGTHADLVAADGMYRRLYAAHQRLYELG